METSIYVIDAWRAVQEPDAISQAVALGEQIIDLLSQAGVDISMACQNVNSLVEGTHARCDLILDQIAGEAHRATVVVDRLQRITKGAR